MKWRCVLLYGESIDLRLIFGFAWTLKSSLVLLCGVEVGPKPPQMLQLPWLMWHPSMRHFSFYCMYLHKEMLWCKLRTPNRSKSDQEKIKIFGSASNRALVKLSYIYMTWQDLVPFWVGNMPYIEEIVIQTPNCIHAITVVI